MMKLKIKLPKVVEDYVLYYTHKLKSYYALLKSRLDNILVSNIELSFFYIFNKNISDANFRINMIEQFASKSPEYKLCRGFLYLYINKKDEGLNLINEYLQMENIENKEFADFLYKCWLDQEPIKDIPEEVYENILKIQSPFFDDLYSKVKSYNLKQVSDELKKLEYNKKTSLNILDLGSCDGSYIKNLYKSFGNEPFIIGVEPNLKLYEEAKSTEKLDLSKLYNEIYNQKINEFLKSNNRKYDVLVNMYHLRYLNNLEFIMVESKKLLKTSGIIIFSLYIDKNLETPIYNKFDNLILYPEKLVMEYINNNSYEVLYKSNNTGIGNISFIIKSL